MGHFVRFIHNRDLAAESISYAYTRQMFILSAPPGHLQGLSARLDGLFKVPNHSSIAIANEIKALHASLPGEYGLQVCASKRNNRMRLLSRDEYSCIKSILDKLREKNWFKWNMPNAEQAAHVIMTAGTMINYVIIHVISHVTYHVLNHVTYHVNYHVIIHLIYHVHYLFPILLCIW